MNWFHRREFLQRTAVLGTTAAMLGTSVAGAQAAEEPRSKEESANDRLRVAVVGVRSRGMSHIGRKDDAKGSGFLDPKNNCEIVAVCDCDEGVIGNAMKTITEAQGSEPKFVQDFRKLIEDPTIDIISIATPNHWHATMAVWAMRAGKDVYCEKPATHNVHEGRLMVEAARKHKRICQVGTQSRSNPGMRAAIEYIHSGKLGKVLVGYGTCYKPRKSIGKVDGPQQPPKTMNYDLWCGPASDAPPHRKTGNGTVHYDWHWIWQYGNGDYGNQGVHEADKARWGMNVGMPTQIVSTGGRFGYTDDGETPNTQFCLYQYPDAHLMFEVRGLETRDILGAKVGNIWYCEKGYVVCPSYSGGAAYDMDGQVLERFGGGGDQHHFRNFVKAVRSRDVKELNCDVLEGHMSAALCHLGNISYRLGRKATMSDAMPCFDGCDKAGEALTRMRQHLSDNKVDPAAAEGLLGAILTFDPETEKFTGIKQSDADLGQANAMLFREYRKGYEIV
jgi:hypothetical protein